MKTKILAAFLSFLSLSLSASQLVTQDPTVDYQPQAQQWAEKVIHRVDKFFLTDLLELLYASYMRSYMTLVVQREYTELFSRVGSGWNHIISRRLDPSKDETFNISAITIDTKFIQQLEIFQKNCAVQKEYVDLLNRLADDSHVTYQGLKTDINYKPCRLLIDELRDNARTVVAESLINVMYEIQQEIQKAQESISQAAALFKTESQLKSKNFVNRSITELLWYYVPQLMVKSFTHFDRGYTAASKQCLDAYLESQKIGNQIWERIEVARAAFYAAHYNALYVQVQQWVPQTLRIQHPSVLIEQLTDYTCLT